MSFRPPFRCGDISCEAIVTSKIIADQLIIAQYMAKRQHWQNKLPKTIEIDYIP
jgi:hypothetical protein